MEAVRQRATDLALVLLDVGLPDGDGFDVCHEIKSSHPGLPVVLISSVYRSAHARRHGISAGADAYLVEPMSPERLVDTVRRLTSPEAPADETPAVLRTTASGIIVSLNERGAALLNIAPRAASGRNLLTFLNGDRGRVQVEMARAAGGEVCEFDAPLRPRERRPLTIRVDLAPAVDGGPGELEWVVKA
jgi:DNA-binding response OmpR family regulator